MDDPNIKDDEKAKNANSTAGLTSILRQPRIAMSPVVQPKRVISPPFANTFLAANNNQTNQHEVEVDRPPPSISARVMF